jgi:hypothetical protein
VPCRDDRERVGANLVGGVAVRGDAVRAHEDAVDLTPGEQLPRSGVRDHGVRDLRSLELPGRQPRALEERTRFVHEHVS